MPEALERLVRPHSDALDQLLGVPFPIAPDGFLRVIDYKGTEDSIVQAARVSYGKGTKKISEDRQLIRSLIRERHTTPLEHPVITFHVRVPMDTWRQWIRHRTASVSEYSTRYSEAIDAAATTAPDAWRRQDGINKQGSDGFLDLETGQMLTAMELAFLDNARDVYQARLDTGVAREQARKDLPLSTYTEAYWTCNLHNLLHFLGLRMDKHAQIEIRTYAHAIGQVVEAWCPTVWQAIKDYRMNAISLSEPMCNLIVLVQTGQQPQAMDLATSQGWLKRKSRERIKIESILECLRIPCPWQEVNLE